MGFDVAKVRADFPILSRRVHGKPLVFMDHGASTHAPRPVLDEVRDLMENGYANVHRGNHTLSREASGRFEQAVEALARFVHADAQAQSLVLASNTTQALDLATHVMAGIPGDVVTTSAEHHSNDLPHRRRGRTLHAAVDDVGRIDLDHVQRLLDAGNVKLLAVTGASNVTGWMPPIHRLARMAHDAGARILVDAAQLLAHAPIDMRKASHPEHLDFLAAAGHKAYAPFGSSFLAGPTDLFDAAAPYIPGGGTVEWVTDTAARFTKGPDRHQGGTPNVVGAVAFAAAARYLQRIGLDNVRGHEKQLVRHGLRRFAELEDAGVHLLGPSGTSETAARDRGGIFTFVMERQRHAVVSDLLDRHWGIATRNGCFCAHPLLHRLLKLGDATKWIQAVERGDEVELPGATRASLGIYNTEAELDLLAEAVGEIAKGKMAGRPEAVATSASS